MSLCTIKAVYFIPKYELSMIFQVIFFSPRHLTNLVTISIGKEYFSYWWFRLDPKKQRVIYNFNLLKACELNMPGFNNDTVILNSSCICLCEWWLKKANLLTSFLADTEVIALWVCFHLLIHSNFYFWLLLQKLRCPGSKYSYHAIVEQGKITIHKKKKKKKRNMAGFIIKHSQ